MNRISIQILENGGLWSISSRLLFSLTYMQDMQIFQKIHCIGIIDDVKKEEKKSNKIEHSYIFEKDVTQLYWFCH